MNCTEEFIAKMKQKDIVINFVQAWRNDTLEESYARLYAAMKDMEERYTPVSEPRFTGYFGKVNAMYNGLRQMQKEMPARAAAGEDVDALALEVWEYFKTFA